MSLGTRLTGSECSVGDPEWRRLKLKHVWQLVVCASANHQQQAAHRWFKLNMDGCWVPFMYGPYLGKGHTWTAVINASLFRCTCMYSHISCPGWRNGWHMWYLAIFGKDFSTYASSSLAYYAHVTVHSDKSCCVPWQLVNQQFAACSGSPHNDESSHYLNWRYNLDFLIWKLCQHALVSV